MIGARVRIVPKRAVLDPQGEAVLRGLHEHGHAQVRDVRVGRIVELLLDTDDEAAARAQIDEMCTQLLVNDVVEVGEVELVDPATVGAAGVLELDGGGR